MPQKAPVASCTRYCFQSILSLMGSLLIATSSQCLSNSSAPSRINVSSGSTANVIIRHQARCASGIQTLLHRLPDHRNTSGSPHVNDHMNALDSAVVPDLVFRRLASIAAGLAVVEPPQFTRGHINLLFAGLEDDARGA